MVVEGGCGCGRGHYRGGVSSSNGGVNSEENVRVCNTNEENIHVEPYVSSAGPRVSVGDILQLLRPPVFDTETNRYARLCRERAGEEHTWETTEEEIMAYLGFTILMGLNRLPYIYDYWSTESFLHYFEISS